VKYLEENVGALNVQLSPRDLAEIEKIFPKGAVAGERYNEQMMRLIDAAWQP
jgi:hypothetical protein